MSGQPHGWTAWLLAGLLAFLCGLMLVLIIALALTPGYILRAFGSVMINGAEWSQRRIVQLMTWADKKLYPYEKNQ